MVLRMMVLQFWDFILPGTPEQAGERFCLTIITHPLVGFLALPLGLFVVIRGNGHVSERLQFSNYKQFMRAANAHIMFVILQGTLVYLAWLVYNPNPPVFK